MEMFHYQLVARNCPDSHSDPSTMLSGALSGTLPNPITKQCPDKMFLQGSQEYASGLETDSVGFHQFLNCTGS